MAADETNPDDWFARAQQNIENTHWSLRIAKADASDDEKYSRELKYVLRGFSHANSLFRELPPNPDETHVAFLERVVPTVAEVPEGVAEVDREHWTGGIREFVRALSYRTTFKYPPLTVVPKIYVPSLGERLGVVRFWQELCYHADHIRYRIASFFSF
ncbi:MAG: hypothetical protein ABJB74_15650 [Gemmatimonas sp.]